jgi:hypothetical protein
MHRAVCGYKQVNIAKLPSCWGSHKTSWFGTKRATRGRVHELPQGFIVRADNLFIDDARQLHCNCDQCTDVRHFRPLAGDLTLPEKLTWTNQSSVDPYQSR